MAQLQQCLQWKWNVDMLPDMHCLSVWRIWLVVWVFASGMAAATEKPLIYVGLPPQRWLVQQLAGERVQTGLLLAPGQNPHTFEPSARQVKEFTAAQGFLMMGLPFERALVQKVKAINPGLRVIDMAAGVPRRMQHAHASGEKDDDGCCEGADPHVWLTPAAMGIMASNTVQALLTFDPEGKDFYTARNAALQARLTRLDAELRVLLLPVRGGVLLTYHASWGYFADAYGLRQLVIEAEGRAPAARQLAALIDQASQAQVRKVFTEPPYDPRPSQTVANQIHAEVAVIDPLAEEWDANLLEISRQVCAALLPKAAAK